jgi:hypothetical protein
MKAQVRRMIGLALAVSAGCGDDDSFSPTVGNVAGSYSAAAFTVTSSTGTTDFLAAGAAVMVELAPDGTTTGQIFVPDGGEDGGDFDADLTGTWTLSDTTVTFEHEADTFLRDVEFIASRNRLSAEETFAGHTIRLVLTKSE